MSNYRNYLLPGLLVLSLGATLPAFASAANPTSRLAESPFETFTQVSQLYSQAGVRSILEKRGPLVKSTANYGISHNVVQETSVLKGFPRALAADGAPAATMTQAEAMDKGIAWMQANVSPVATRMAQHLKGKGSASGVITYSEEVFITREEGDPVLMQLSFLMYVDNSGKPTYGAPVLSAADPDVLYATYTPKKAGDSFNESWALPNAGSITYNIIDSKGNPKTTAVTVNVNGAYDDQDGNDTGVRCLMDRSQSGCIDGGTDIKALMNKSASSLAIVDYMNQITPVYDEKVGTDGQPEYVPRGAISYTDRTWDCKVFGNTGDYGFVLNVRVDRYYGKLEQDNTVSYTLMESHEGRAISPVKSFSKEVPITSVPSNPKDWVISPVTGDDTLFSISDAPMEGLVYLAPVRLTGSTDVFDKLSPSGDFPYKKLPASGSGLVEYLYGEEVDNGLSTGAYSGTLEFQLDSPEDLSEFWLERVRYDDYLLMTLNDHVIYGGPFEPTVKLDWNNGKEYIETNQFPACFKTQADSRGVWVCGTVAGGSEVKHLAYGQYDTDFYCSTTTTEFINNNIPPAGKACVKSYEFFKSCEAWQMGMSDGDGTTTHLVGCSRNSCTFVPKALSHLHSSLKSVEYTLENGDVNCGALEQNNDWSRNLHKDLTPYLESGNNVIKTLALVGDEGEFWSNFSIKGCGAELGLEEGDAPTVPATGTPAGLSQTLEQMRDN